MRFKCYLGNSELLALSVNQSIFQLGNVVRKFDGDKVRNKFDNFYVEKWQSRACQKTGLVLFGDIVKYGLKWSPTAHSLLGK